ncbi:MAG: hypothetical protein A2033_19270 [Bacteroidetes bacterium GWA2_31_9]|nr:MAG: hypothetical protein A2033_19270 [Bacteroidetes bacterium GWA2_31_9]
MHKLLIVFICISAIYLTSCSSSKKYFEKGMYDSAVQKAVKKIRKKQDHAKSIEILEKAYPLANEKNIDRINFLKKEGKPDVWDEVYKNYSLLKDRQNLVKTVLPLNLNGRTITFQTVDYDNEIIAAKKNAAEYFYVHAQKLLETNDKIKIREAYYEFKKVKNLYPDYKDVDPMIDKAKQLGLSWVFVYTENNTIIKLPPDFMDNLINVDLPKYNSEWVQYTNQNIYSNIDYKIKMNLTIIDISPEKIKEDVTLDKKEIEDGWDYYLDSKGNVMKDSLGNDIKKPKYKTITCKVTKSMMTKAAHIEGKLEYIQASTGQVIKTVPVAADNFFNHIWAVAIGDIDALSPENKKYLGIKPIPFPPDINMILDAGNNLKGVINKALNDNKYFLK